MEAKDVRVTLGKEKIIGFAVQTVEQALEAQRHGAYYLGVGSVFATGTKEDAKEVSHETLKEICEAVDIPVIAIGGINERNVMKLEGSGICGIAVISAIFAQPDIKEAARRLHRLAEEMIDRMSGKKKGDVYKRQVQDGEMLVITGPNGGGKSTLAKLLMGIYKETAGKIYLDGQDITELSIDERAKAGIGFAFQQPPRFKGMTVRRLLSLAAGKVLDEKTCCELLSSVGSVSYTHLDVYKRQGIL